MDECIIELLDTKQNKGRRRKHRLKDGAEELLNQPAPVDIDGVCHPLLLFLLHYFFFFSFFLSFCFCFTLLLRLVVVGVEEEEEEVEGRETVLLLRAAPLKWTGAKCN